MSQIKPCIFPERVVLSPPSHCSALNPPTSSYKEGELSGMGEHIFHAQKKALSPLSFLASKHALLALQKAREERKEVEGMSWGHATPARASCHRRMYGGREQRTWRKATRMDKSKSSCDAGNAKRGRKKSDCRTDAAQFAEERPVTREDR